jgi:hypothetical protein
MFPAAASDSVRAMRNRTLSGGRAAIATLLACLLVPAGAGAEDLPAAEPEGPGAGAIAFDVLVLRPLGFLVLPVSCAAFLPAALLSAPGGLERLTEVYEQLVKEPAAYVFQRPLGEI